MSYRFFFFLLKWNKLSRKFPCIFNTFLSNPKEITRKNLKYFNRMLIKTIYLRWQHMLSEKIIPLKKAETNNK